MKTMARWEFRIKFLMVFCSYGISAQVVPSSLDFGMSRRPGTTCTFNPCTIPNFCGSGRTCEIDDNCISRCNCLDDSIHPDCIANKEVEHAPIRNGLTVDKTILPGLNDSFISKKQSKLDDDPITSNTSVTKQCNFDPCKTMAWLCDGGRTCVTRDCILHCECTPDSTHSSCMFDRPTETNDTEYCGGFSGMRCIHGECVRIENAWSCQCDEDWRGALCDQHVSTGCTRACDYGYECSWYMNTLQICKPKRLTTTIHNSIKENSTSLSSTLNPCLQGYVYHHISHRNCTSELLCQFGVCENIQNGSSICVCDQGAFGSTCNLTCCKDCGVGGECVINDDNGYDDDDGREVCRCYPNFSGRDCVSSTEAVTTIKWYTWLFITCSIVLILLVILLVVVPYVLWKRRVIPIMKIVHHFQGYEDNDGREFDVFIFSPPGVHNFVTQVLVPKLDGELGLKIFIHYQNCSSENSMTDDVLQTIKKSRRVIFVFRPDSSQSDSSRSLCGPLKHLKDLSYKNRIIPILLESVPVFTSASQPKMMERLKLSNPLKWPDRSCEKRLGQFWKRLELCLPKKRSRINSPRLGQNSNQNGSILKQQLMGTKKNHHQNGNSVTHIYTEYETDHYHKINGISRL